MTVKDAGKVERETHQPRSARAELRDAITPRTVGLVIAVLLQLGFILSYVGAMHDPSPHRIEVAALAPQRVVAQLNALPGEPLTVSAVSSETEARARVLDRSVSAALIMDPAGARDTLFVASAGGPALATAVQEVVGRMAAAAHRDVTVVDLVVPRTTVLRARLESPDQRLRQRPQLIGHQPPRQIINHKI